MADAKAPAAPAPDTATLIRTQTALCAALDVLAAAPSVTEVLARPMVYEAWLKKAQDAING